MSERGTRRRHRAAVARRLVRWRTHPALVASAARDRLDTLTWQEIETLPAWCALGDEALAGLVPLVGAVSLLPAVRRSVRGDVLRRLVALLGERRLHALRTRPYRATAESVALAAPDALAAQLAARGVRALLATLDDPALAVLAATVLLSGSTSAPATSGTLGQTAGDDPIETATVTIACALQREVAVGAGTRAPSLAGERVA